MGIIITKDNIDELLTSYIDGQIQDEETKNKISDLVKSDEKVLKKYKSELLTKQYLKSKLEYSEVPDETRLRITTSIDNLIYSSAQKNKVISQQSDTAFFHYLKNIFTSPVRIKSFAVPRYAFAVVILFTVLFMSIFVFRGQNTQLNTYIASGSDNRFISQALNNFHRILDGETIPEIESKSAKDISNSLQEKAKFIPYVPDITDYVLRGFNCNEFNGKKLVHLLYKSGNDVIYIYQTEVSSLNDRKLELPESVREKIVKEKFYLCDKPDEKDCTLLIWFADDVLCAAVSNIPKQNLFSKFAGLK